MTLTVVLTGIGVVVTIGIAIATAASKIRDKIDDTRKELSSENKDAHSGISDNIKELRKEAREDRDRTDGKIDGLNKMVGDLRVEVARLPASASQSQSPAEPAPE